MAETLQELEDLPCVEFDRIEKVDFAEMFNGVIYTSEGELTLAKADDVRAVRNSYLEKYVDPKQLVMVWDGLSEEERQLYADYRTYLLDYTELEGWYLEYPKTLEEWKISYVPEVEEISTEPSETKENEEETPVEEVGVEEEIETVSETVSETVTE